MKVTDFQVLHLNYCSLWIRDLDYKKDLKKLSGEY